MPAISIPATELILGAGLGEGGAAMLAGGLGAGGAGAAGAGGLASLLGGLGSYATPAMLGLMGLGSLFNQPKSLSAGQSTPWSDPTTPAPPADTHGIGETGMTPQQLKMINPRTQVSQALLNQRMSG